MTAVSIFYPVTGTSSNWLATTISDIAASDASTGGILGALSSSKGATGSIKEFLNNTSADNLATISQSSVTNSSAFYAQIAAQNQKDRNNATLQKVLAALHESSSQVKPQNVLDPTIFFADGSTLDTENNILTQTDGTQYDTTTGALYVDPSSIISLANGSYLDTKNNILTLPDGTRIDTITGINLSATA